MRLVERLFFIDRGNDPVNVREAHGIIYLRVFDFLGLFFDVFKMLDDARRSLTIKKEEQKNHN